MDPGLITEITKLTISKTVSIIGSTEYLADWVVENHHHQFDGGGIYKIMVNTNNIEYRKIE